MTFADSGVRLFVFYSCPARARRKLQSRIVEEIWSRFQSDPRVEIAYPHMELAKYEPSTRRGPRRRGRARRARLPGSNPRPSPYLRSGASAARGDLLAETRWRSVGEFLSDMPRFHCPVKPPHSFCTVCLRINAAVAVDCPQRFEDLASAPVRSAPPVAEGDFYPDGPPEASAAEHAAMGHEHVPAAAVLPEGPVIEFAANTEPHQPRKRMKARPVQKRQVTSPEQGGESGRTPQAPMRRDRHGRVWATHEDAGVAPPPPAMDDTDTQELKDLDPETQPAPSGSKEHAGPRSPRPPSKSAGKRRATPRKRKRR